MKQPEYKEGPEALENFKRLATAILQAPAKKKKRQTNSKSRPVQMESAQGTAFPSAGGYKGVGMLH
jgi:hypothetical protein